MLLDAGDHPRPVGFGGDIEGVGDAGAAGQIGGDRNTALPGNRVGDRRADGARGAGDQHDFVFQPLHCAWSRCEGSAPLDAAFLRSFPRKRESSLGPRIRIPLRNPFARKGDS